MRVLYILNSKKDVRDLYLSGLLKIKPEIELICQGSETARTGTLHLERPFLILEEFNFVSKKIASMFSICRLWRYKDRSRSHFIRAISIYGWPKQRNRIGKPLHNGLENHASTLFSFVIRCFAAQPFFSIIKFLFNFMAQIERRKFRYLGNAHVLVIPYLGELDGRFDLIVKIFRKMGVKVISFQANWDSLSSKNFIYSEPDFFGVWGEQSLSQLKTIQRFNFSQGVILGNPRALEVSAANKSPKQSVKKIIFAGDGIGLEDLNILTRIAALPSKDVQIIYRPHPFVRNPIPQDFLVQTFGNRLKILSETTPEDNLSFIQNLQSADLLVSQLSTLCIEALSLKVPVCVPLFASADYRFGYREAFQELNHFTGLRLVPELFPVFSQDDLNATIERVLTSKFSFDSNLQWVCVDRQFSEELLSLLDNLMSSGNNLN